jgi:hypothetical protein
VKRLIFDCSVLALAAWGWYSWKHRPVPQPVPAYRGARPNLDMPAAPEGPAAPEVESHIAVSAKDIDDSAPHLQGHPDVASHALGDRPKLFEKAGPDSTLADEPAGTLSSERSPWLERLTQPWTFAAIVALFLVLYAVLSRALRRGPGGHGFTHD